MPGIPTNIKNTRVFANTAARVAAVPAFIGQFGWQIDLERWWVASALTAGAWSGSFAATTLFAQEYLGFSNQGAEPSAPSAGLRMFGFVGELLGIKNPSNIAAFLDISTLSADRIYAFPDAGGVLLVDGDLSFLNGDHGNITVTGAGATAGTWTIDNGVVTNSMHVTGIVAPRVAATWADVYATAADRNGQIGVSNDGSVGVFRDGVGGTNQQKWESDVVWQPGINYFHTVAIDTALTQSAGTSQLRSLTVSAGSFTVSAGAATLTTTGAAGSHVFQATGGTFIDNAAIFYNSTGGYSTAIFARPGDGASATSRALAVGFAPASGPYTSIAYIATNPISSAITDAPPDIGIFQERDDGGSGGAITQHRRIYCDATNKLVTLYGWTNDTIIGNVGVQVNASGNVTLAPTSAGTVTIGGGATASELRFLEPSGSGTNYTALKAQAQAGNVTYTLPNSDGTSGYALTTNGSGTLLWAAMATGSGTKTKAVFTPLDNQPPAANFATIDTRNSIALLAFDETTEESAIFVGVMPEGASLGSGLTVTVKSVAVATTGDFRLGAAWMRCNTDIDSDSFDTAVEATTTISATSGIPVSTDLTTTNIDGITAGDMFRLKIYRDTSDGGDTMSGDLQCLTFEVKTVD